MKVFIGDNSPLVREWLNRVFERIGGIETVGYAEKTEEVPNAVAALLPDLVILDFKIGENWARVLKQIKKTSQPPPLIIVFANHPSALYRKRLLAAGADYYFDRSTEQKQLAEKLKEVIYKHRIRE